MVLKTHLVAAFLVHDNAAIGVNILLTVVQIVAGIFSGSLALVADAIHNLSDALSLVVAPLLLLGGYLGVAAAVLWGVPRDSDPEAPEADEVAVVGEGG